MIGGDSGTGKTLFFKIMQSQARNNRDIICINADSMWADINSVISTSKNKLIIMDNADIILNAESKYRILTNKQNQYIILGRNTQGYHLGAKQYAEMQISDNIASLNYILL